MWGPPGPMPRAKVATSCAAKTAPCGRCDDPASGALEVRRPAKNKLKDSNRGRHARSAQRSASAEHIAQEPVSRRRVGEEVKKRPASGPRPELLAKRWAAGVLQDPTHDFRPRDTGSHLDREQPVTTTLGRTMRAPKVTAATTPMMESSNLPTLTPGVLAAIDANIAVHFPSLPRAPSKEFHRMIRKIVAAGNVTLQDGLRIFEKNWASGDCVDLTGS